MLYVPTIYRNKNTSLLKKSAFDVVPFSLLLSGVSMDEIPYMVEAFLSRIFSGRIFVIVFLIHIYMNRKDHYTSHRTKQGSWRKLLPAIGLVVTLSMQAEGAGAAPVVHRKWRR